MPKPDFFSQGGRRMCNMHVCNIPISLILAICLVSLVLNAYRWANPYNVESSSIFTQADSIDNQLRRIDDGAPESSAIQESPAKVETAKNEEEKKSEKDKPVSKEYECALRFPIPRDTVLLKVGFAAGIPEFTILMYKENDVVSNMLQSGVVYRNHVIKAAVLDYADKISMDDQVVVDMGANIGLFTLSALAMGYEVVAVEPMESNIAMLLYSACINNFLDRLTLVQAGVADKEQVCWVIASNKNKGNGMSACTEDEQDALLTGEQDNGQKFEVQSIARYNTLDALVANNRQVRVMKVDIEGYEHSALSKESARKFFSGNSRPSMVFGELYHSYTGGTCMEDDGAYIKDMLARDYVLSTIGSNEYKETIESICENPPVYLVWVAREYWDTFAAKAE